MSIPIRRGRRRNRRPYFAAPANILAADSYGRPDNTALGVTDGIGPGFNMSGARPGKPYVEVAGNWEINANRIGTQGSSPGGQGWICTLDIGAADYQLEWTLAFAPDANSNSILLAYVDATNFIRLQHTSTPAVLSWLRVTSGTGSSIGVASTGVTPTIGDTVRVTKIGPAYTARIIRAGVQVGTAATITSEAQGQSSTIVGLRASAASVRWRNFLAERV